MENILRPYTNEYDYKGNLLTNVPKKMDSLGEIDKFLGRCAVPKFTQQEIKIRSNLRQARD